jgi:hypothetical protein
MSGRVFICVKTKPLSIAKIEHLAMGGGILLFLLKWSHQYEKIINFQKGKVDI